MDNTEITLLPKAPAIKKLIIVTSNGDGHVEIDTKNGLISYSTKTLNPQTQTTNEIKRIQVNHGDFSVNILFVLDGKDDGE